MLLRSRGPVQFCVCGDSTQESQASGREGANAESGNWKGRRFHAVPLQGTARGGLCTGRSCDAPMLDQRRDVAPSTSNRFFAAAVAMLVLVVNDTRVLLRVAERRWSVAKTQAVFAA